MKDIEFVSYNGKYPNLCSGVLTLRVDGQIRQFNWCLISGGYCNVIEDLCTIGEWDIKDDVFSDFTENEKEFIRRLEQKISISQRKEYKDYTYETNHEGTGALHQ